MIPAPIEEAELERRIAASDAVAIMKVGRHLAKVRRVLEKLNRLGDATYVERATLDNERVMPMSDVDVETAPYFSMILLRTSEASDA